MIVLGILAVAFVVAYVRRRSSRADTRAGLDSSRPTFSLAPAVRFSTRLKDHRL